MAHFHGYRLPDFIIIGAMKSGTSSVHHMLAGHAQVFMPQAEVSFFDLDDRRQHPDFAVDPSTGRDAHDWDADFETYLQWYAGFFQRADPSHVIGEDSTTYLASAAAADRIARVLPEVKLVAMLRDPVSRAHSHYWHNMAMWRPTQSFDDAVRNAPGNYLERGRYAEQLERYRAFLDGGRLHVVLYEDFAADPQACMNRLCEYLGLAHGVDVAAIDSHRNPARVPWLPGLALARNRVYRSLRPKPIRRDVPFAPGFEVGGANARSPGERSASSRALAWITRAVSRRQYPAMAEKTRAYLEEYFREANAGLADLLGVDVSRRWPYMG